MIENVLLLGDRSFVPSNEIPSREGARKPCYNMQASLVNWLLFYVKFHQLLMKYGAKHYSKSRSCLSMEKTHAWREALKNLRSFITLFPASCRN